MTLLAAIDIAGVCIGLFGAPSIRVIEGEPAVLPFFKAAPPPARPEADAVRLVIDQDSVPRLPPGVVMRFDSRQAWSLWTSAAETVLRLKPPGAPDPLWHLSLGDGFSGGRLHCHDHFWQKTGLAPVLQNPIRYPLDQILLMLRLARRWGIILHAAGAVVDGRGYLFAGKSGAGKSTLAALMSADARARLLSDDRVIVRRVDGRWLVFGTPWPGDARVAVNRCAPLAGVYFLQQGDRLAAGPLSPGAALARLLPVASIPMFDRILGDAVLASCGSLVTEIPMAALCFTRHPGTGAAVVEMLGEKGERS